MYSLSHTLGVTIVALWFGTFDCSFSTSLRWTRTLQASSRLGWLVDGAFLPGQLANEAVCECKWAFSWKMGWKLLLHWFEKGLFTRPHVPRLFALSHLGLRRESDSLRAERKQGATSQSQQPSRQIRDKARLCLEWPLHVELSWVTAEASYTHAFSANTQTRRLPGNKIKPARSGFISIFPWANKLFFLPFLKTKH